jgi:hypothetical protein
MKTLAIGEFKTHFSSVLADIRSGRPVAVAYGKSRRKLAILLPYGQYHKSPGRRLGILESRGNCKLKKDFSMSDEELVVS